MGLAPLTPRTRAAVVSGLAAGPLLAAWLALPLGASAAPPALLAQPAGEVTATLDNKFQPATITISAGGKVTWTNQGGFHTVTGGTDPASSDTSKMNGQLDTAGEKYEVTFAQPGNYPYFCSPHASLGMKGEVVVLAAGATASTTPTAGGTASATPQPATGSPAPGGTSTSEPREGGQGVEATPTGIPGAGSDNLRLEEIHREELAGKDKIGGFNALLGGITAATVALGGAVFASTRPRRAGR